MDGLKKLPIKIMKVPFIRKCIWLIFSGIILAPIISYAQYDDSLLNKELKLFSKKGVSDVYLFGTRCEHCVDAHFNTFYLIYDSASIVKVKKIVYLIKDYEAKFILDSIFLHKDCSIIMDYASKNYDSLHKNLSKSDIIFPTYIDGKTVFKGEPFQGKSYYFGIYARGELDYLVLNSDKAINYLYKYHNECWIFISMMKNEFVQNCCFE